MHGAADQPGAVTEAAPQARGQPPEGSPSCTALKFFLFGTPPMP